MPVGYLSSRINLSKQSQRSFFLPSIFHKATNFRTSISSSTSLPKPNWVSDNKLFQRYPILHCLEKQCKSLDQLKQILPCILMLGLHKNPFVMSRVLYISLFELEADAKIKSHFGLQIFCQIEKRNIFSWNTIIRFFAVSGDPQNSLIAFKYYKELLKQENHPDKYTFPFLLQACGAISDLGFVKQVQSHIVRLGFDQDLFVQNSLLHGFFCCGLLSDAWKLFDEMAERDVVSWTTLISGFVGQGCCSEAVNVFGRLWLDDFRTRPNVATMLSVLSACGKLGSLDHAKCFHALLEKDGWINYVSICNSLIDIYANCGSLDSAVIVFSNMCDGQRDIHTWTGMISGLAMHGRGMDACILFSEMEQVSGLVPDDITFVGILSACVHSGLIKKGLCLFESMKARWGIEPDLRHYGCVIDLLGRAGMLERAIQMMERMPMEPNLSILGSLLSACRIHKNLDLGEVVLKKIESLRGSSGGAPVLLSNIYANESKWEELIHIRKEMRGEIQEKPPGKSWIQLKDTVHEFVVGDKNHPQAMELYMVMEGLERLTKMPVL